MKITQREADALASAVRSTLKLRIDCLGDERPVLARPLTEDEWGAVEAIDQSCIAAYGVIAQAIDEARMAGGASGLQFAGLNTVLRGINSLRAEIELLLQADERAHGFTAEIRK
jgi:hypothetical protein